MADNVKGLRITVLGGTGCGKTCLINSYVNNYCPNVYVPTDDPALYYRTIRAVASDKDDRLINVMLEIEDTYSSERTDGKTHFAKTRKYQHFIDPIKGDTGGGGHDIPGAHFASADPPKESEYHPVTKGCMAFILMFDINDTKSFDHIKKVYDYLDQTARAAKNQKPEHKPIVWLVANKIDADPHSRDDHHSPIHQNLVKIKALQRDLQRDYLDGRGSSLLYDDHGKGKDNATFRFMEISVYEFTKVRRLFRHIVDDLLEYKKPMWETQADQADDDAQESGGGMLGGLSLFGGGNTGGGGGVFGGFFG